MKDFNSFTGQVMVKIVVFVIIQLFALLWFGRPHWVMDNISYDALFKICVSLLLFNLFFIWQMIECYRRFNNAPDRDKYAYMDPPGVFQHKKLKYKCCPRCFQGDNIKSIMITDVVDTLKCPVCGLQL